MAQHHDGCPASPARPRRLRRRRKAVTLHDLGTCTVDRLTSRRRGPYYTITSDTALDDVLPELIAMNTAGLVTVKAQTAADDDRSRRCAVLHAFGHPDLVIRVADTCAAAGLQVTTCAFGSPPRPIHPPVPIAWGPGPQRQVAAISIGPCIVGQYMFGFAHPAAREAMDSALSIEIIDPVRGREDLLWSTVTTAVGRCASEAEQPTTV